MAWQGRLGWPMHAVFITASVIEAAGIETIFAVVEAGNLLMNP